MKKLLILIPVLLMVTLVFPNNLSFFNKAQQVNKEINLSLFSGSNYNSAAYDDALASVEITVSKVTANKAVVIGKKTYSALQLKQFPAAANAINQKLMISGKLAGNEALVVTYTITYNSNGSIITFADSKMISKETATDNVNISI